MAGRRQRLQREVARPTRRPGSWPSGASKPSACGGHLPVDREGRAGQRGGAQRALVHPRPGVGEAAGVAAEHLDIGHQVVAEGHRLGRLQMGEARHQGVARAPRPWPAAPAAAPAAGSTVRSQASRTHRRKSSATWSLRERAVCSRPAAGADQLVAAAPRRSCGCPRTRRGTGRSRRRSRPRSRPGRRWIAASSSAEMIPRRGQHGGVGARAREVLRRQAPVEADRDVDRLHQRAGLGGEAAAPEALAFARLGGGGPRLGVVGAVGHG